MRLQLSVIGVLKDPAFKMIEETYHRRIHRWPVSIVELGGKASPVLDGAVRMRQEGDLIAASCPPGSTLWLLDERGDDCTSEEIARFFSAAEQSAVRTLVLAIGGADGHHRDLRQKAHRVLSFGRQTWPHAWVRSMVMEQIYRAQQILIGHPYHRG